MQPGNLKTLGAALSASGFLVLALGVSNGWGDEPGRLGRLFRFGGGSTTPAVTTQPPPEALPEVRPVPAPAGDPPVSNPPSSMTTPAGAQPRLIPQPRVSRPATEADPIVTRIALGRSDDGRQFGMFLQVFADGTVIDSEGVHHASREAIKEVVNALEPSELYRFKGHCGAPSTDFVEQVHLVVYERTLGRLRANAFSFSGNTQGCDHAVVHLQNALDGLQARLSRPATSPTPAARNEIPTQSLNAAPIQLNGGSAPLR